MALPLFFLQHVADGHSNQVATIAGVMNYVLLKNAHYLMLSYFLIKFVFFLTEQGLADYPRRKFDRVLRWLVISIASIFFAVEGYMYLIFPLETVPVTISHRGVSQENGVQNTIQSLEKTALLKLDYIEWMYKKQKMVNLS